MIQRDINQPDLEYELVLAIVSLDPSKHGRISEILDGPLDWSLLLQIANQLGVFPLCCQRLMTLAEKQMPAEESTRWKALFQAYTQNNVRLTWKLAECVELLLNNGIECIVLKGPVFAIQAYSNLTVRQYTDIDILIHPSDFPKTCDLLTKFGYVSAFTLDERQKKALLRSGNHFSFNRQGDLIEVHWDVLPPGSLPLLTSDEMWQQLSSVHIFDQDFFTLSPENTILFTCIHGTKHGWNQLKWIVDLAYLSQAFSETDWFLLLEHAKRKGLFRQVCLGLLLAMDLVDLEIPLLIRDQLSSNRHTQVLASQVKASLSKLSNKQSPMDVYKFYLTTLERWQDCISYLFSLVFIPQPRDWQAVSLPENLYFLYYLLRPIRLLYKYGKAVISASP